ncbi:MAG TPA: hypothetical protein PK425_04550, partial [Syntrophales bacterium]|nr:hypothetical protein [Syntrophales bacterium]
MSESQGEWFRSAKLQLFELGMNTALSITSILAGRFTRNRQLLRSGRMKVSFIKSDPGKTGLLSTTTMENRASLIPSPAVYHRAAANRVTSIFGLGMSGEKTPA